MKDETLQGAPALRSQRPPADSIGFYALRPTADEKGLLAALLVTDDLGKPEEFRVTYPVKPTLLQKQLYGESLLPHVGIELCGKPLYQALKKKPSLLIVSDARFLRLAYAVDCSVAHLQKLGEVLQVGTPNSSQGRQTKLSSSSGRFQPVVVTLPFDCPEEQQRRTEALLARYYAGVDLLEPFKRIEVALQVLADQDIKFR